VAYTTAPAIANPTFNAAIYLSDTLLIALNYNNGAAARTPMHK